MMSLLDRGRRFLTSLNPFGARALGKHSLVHQREGLPCVVVASKQIDPFANSFGSFITKTQILSRDNFMNLNIRVGFKLIPPLLNPCFVGQTEMIKIATCILP